MQHGKPDYDRYDNISDTAVRDKSSAVKNIIIANIVIFILSIIILSTGILSSFVHIFGLVPKYIWSKGMVWQFVTHMFLHGGLSHIFWNMFVLYIIGKELECSWGRREFYKFYFFTGIGAGMIAVIFNLGLEGPIVGASGAIYGLLLAFGLMFPRRRVYVLFLIPIQARFLVGIMALITFFSTILGREGPVCYSAHLGGIIVGFLYILLSKSEKLPDLNLSNINIVN